MLKYVIFKTLWGWFGILSGPNGIIRTCLPAISISKTKEYLLVGIDRQVVRENGLYADLQYDITHYFSRSYEPRFRNIKLDFSSLSAFQKSVLTAVIQVPYGQTITYSRVAHLVGCPKAYRAVGTALANNPFPLIVPCHRVIKTDGSIGNFSGYGGERMKRKMLKLESLASPCRTLRSAVYSGK